MRGYPLERHGAPEVLRLRELPEPAAEKDGAVVALETIGLNWAEVQSRLGLYGWAPPLPYVPGMEGFGEIVALGPDARGHELGEKVIVGAQYGCYAERIALPAARLSRAIPGYTAEENAAFAVNYLTAWVALFEMARLRAGDRVLIDAAAGGVGTAAVQLARHARAEVIALAGSAEKLAFLRELGVAAAINYREAGWDEQVRRATGGRGIDVLLALVAGETFRRNLRLLAPFGRAVVAGVAGLRFRRKNPLTWWRAWRDMPRVDLRRLFPRSQGVMATHIGYLLGEPERLGAVWERLRAFVAEHDIHPIVGATFGFEEIPVAHARMEQRGTIGKVVVRVHGESRGAAETA
jgi:NADPH2:quinone reductase